MMKKNKFLDADCIYEKRKLVATTPLCNNNCIFCVDGDVALRKHKPFSKLKNELKEGIKEGCERLILTGGEPTIYPHYLDIIRFGKEVGYKKIQTITNGRRFSYKKFLDAAVKAGLDEITFSVHGHTATLHDSLTGVQGSFSQTIRGVKNALKGGLIVNADIVLNKKNIRYFPDIIKFLIGLGIGEFDILQIVPFGNAWVNKDKLFYNLNKNICYIRKGFYIAKKHNIVIWTNRFPAEYLVGFEGLIQDPYKLIMEIDSRKDEFEKCLINNLQFPCQGARCASCHLKEVCSFLIKNNKLLHSKNKKIIRMDITKRLPEPAHLRFIKDSKKVKELIIETDKLPPKKILRHLNNVNSVELIFMIKEHNEKVYQILGYISENNKIKVKPNIVVTKENVKDLQNITKSVGKLNFKKCLFSLVPPRDNYRQYSKIVPDMKNAVQCLSSSFSSIKEFNIRDIPPCLINEKYRGHILEKKDKILDLDAIGENQEINIVSLTKNFVEQKKIKSLSCRRCRYDERCDGIFQKYIMKYGFSQLKPILK